MKGVNYKTLYNSFMNLLKKFDELEAENKKLMEENRRLKADNEELENRHSVLKAEHDKLGAEHDKLGAEHDALKHEIDVMKDDIKNMNESIRGHEKDIADAKYELQKNLEVLNGVVGKMSEYRAVLDVTPDNADIKVALYEADSEKRHLVHCLRKMASSCGRILFFDRSKNEYRLIR